ncbi:MAG: hypothetical protein KAT75_00655 [Dehalococcoidia bacterium]|nr:hypothetical protein [Dehalococcoidia bacterium]
MKWMPKDVIACIIIVACFVLLALGKDSVVSWALLGVVCAYYGIDLTPWVHLGRNQQAKKEVE